MFDAKGSAAESELWADAKLIQDVYRRGNVDQGFAVSDHVFEDRYTSSYINNAQLELSNVDLSVQFTDMIRAERGFQANSRVITSADEILQDLVNIGR